MPQRPATQHSASIVAHGKMTAVPARAVRFRHALPGLFLVLLPAAGGARPKTAADVPPTPGPYIVSLAAEPAPDLRSITARAVIRAEGLTRPAVLSLSVGASAAWVKIEPGAEVTVERSIPLTRVKPWTPARPVRFLLIGGLNHGAEILDRRGIRFAMRTLLLRDGRLLLNGDPFQIRGASSPAGAARSVAAFKELRAAGYNALLLAPADRTDAVHDACDAAGLLALDEIPAPGPAVDRLRPAPDPAPDDRALAVFGSATAFADAVRAAVAERHDDALSATRRDPARPGFVLAGGPPPDLADRFGPRSIALAPPPTLVDPAVAPSATVAFGPGPWPADAVLEWRAGPGDGPADDDAWHLARPVRPVAAGTSRALALPGVDSPGRWTMAVRVRAGRRTLAQASAAYRGWENRDPSQVSFAVMGAAPELRATYGAWIIPPEHATVIVACRPASQPPAELAAVFAWLARGKTVVFPGLTRADAAALSAHPAGCWTLEAADVDPAAPSHLTWIRPDRFGARLPGTGLTEPGRWFAGPPFLPLLPVLSLRPLPGATVWAGEAALDPDGVSLAGLMTVPAGAGKAVFCQWRLLEALPDPFARRLFERLLGL